MTMEPRHPHFRPCALALAFLAAALLRAAADVSTPSVTITVKATPGATALSVDCETPGAVIEIDGFYAGYAPVEARAVEPGRHTIRTRKPGFTDAFLEVIIERDTTVSVLLILEAPRGELELETWPRDVLVEIDGKPAPLVHGELQAAGPGIRKYSLLAGTRTIRVSSFGYLPAETTVEISPDLRTVLPLRLEPAPFALLSLAASGTTLAPGARGREGLVRFRAEISARGSVDLAISAEAGSPIRTLYMEPAELSPGLLLAEWDGLDGEGLPVPDGRYLVVPFVHVGEERDRGGEAAGVEPLFIVADAGSAGFPAGLLSGLPGPEHLPSPFADPPWSVRTAAGIELETGGTGVDATRAAASLAIAVGGGFEAGLHATVGEYVGDGSLRLSVLWAAVLPGGWALSPRATLERRGAPADTASPFDRSASYSGEAALAAGFGSLRRWAAVSLAFSAVYGDSFQSGASGGAGLFTSGSWWSLACSARAYIPDGTAFPAPSVALEACVEPFPLPLALDASCAAAFPEGGGITWNVSFGLSARL